MFTPKLGEEKSAIVQNEYLHNWVARKSTKANAIMVSQIDSDHSFIRDVSPKPWYCVILTCNKSWKKHQIEGWRTSSLKHHSII